MGMVKEKKGVKLLCQTCGGQFLVGTYEAANRNPRFCCARCQAVGNVKRPPPREELVLRYERNRISANRLSAEYGVSDTTIKKWLALYEIKSRSMGQAVSIARTGQQHSDATRLKISAAHKAAATWAGKRHPNFKYPDRWSSGKRGSKGGRRGDLGNQYFRSRWEANVARYLNWLISLGEVSKWEYEPDCFAFEGIKRGARFYTPDFKVTERSGAVVYWEVKGWMDPESKTKIKRMAKYHPEVRLIVIDGKGYKAIATKVSRLIAGWETKTSAIPEAT